ncbi:MAG TPA: DNA-binding protein [Marinobacter sp.]|jgi:uncharacterized metal-binding protein (TIGR02443 family)|nr:DNA-binding protein [Marinobacter sp.]
MSSIKRFIAGAICPRCAEMDKITMHITDDGDQVRECVSCGYTDALSEQEPPANPELVTRVNQRANNDDHTVRQVVFFKSSSDD